MVVIEYKAPMVIQLMIGLILTSQVRSSSVVGLVYCYGEVYVFADGQQIYYSNTWKSSTSFQVPDDVQVLGVSCRDAGNAGRITMSLSNGVTTDHSWRCSPLSEDSWLTSEFNDTEWQPATVTLYPDNMYAVFGTLTWIWTDNKTDDIAYCRKVFKTNNEEPQCKCEDVQQEVTSLKAEMALIQSELTTLKAMVTTLELNQQNTQDVGNGNVGVGDLFG